MILRQVLIWFYKSCFSFRSSFEEDKILVHCLNYLHEHKMMKIIDAFYSLFSNWNSFFLTEYITFEPISKSFFVFFTTNTFKQCNVQNTCILYVDISNLSPERQRPLKGSGKPIAVIRNEPNIDIHFYRKKNSQNIILGFFPQSFPATEGRFQKSYVCWDVFNTRFCHDLGIGRRSFLHFLAIVDTVHFCDSCHGWEVRFGNDFREKATDNHILITLVGTIWWSW